MNTDLLNEGVSLGRLAAEGALGPAWLWVVTGVVLLFLGRHLYTALIGLLGFFFSYAASPDLVVLPSEYRLIIAVIVGIFSAVLALLLRKFAVFLAGGMLGAGGAVWALSLVELPSDVLFWAALVLAAVLGAWVLHLVFETALVVVSSFIGALLVVAAAGLEGLPARIGVAALIVVGVVVQTRPSREKSRRSRRAAGA